MNVRLEKPQCCQDSKNALNVSSLTTHTHRLRRDDTHIFQGMHGTLEFEESTLIAIHSHYIRDGYLPVVVMGVAVVADTKSATSRPATRFDAMGIFIGNGSTCRFPGSSGKFSPAN